MPPKKVLKKVSKVKVVIDESPVQDVPVMAGAAPEPVVVVSVPRGETSVVTGSNGGVVGSDTREVGVVIR